MMYVSCAHADIYRNGSWFDDPVLLNEFRHGPSAARGPDIVAELYPAYSYERPDPALFGGGERERAQVESVARSTNTTFRNGAATGLARAENACVSRAVVYMLDEDNVRVVYETHRPHDRAVSVLRNDSEIRMVDEYRRADPFVAYLWVGSPGSKNYGHWLVDDLPKLRALSELRRLRPYAKIVIVTIDCGETHNTVHAQSAGAIAESLELENIELITVSWEARLFFQELYFVTPVTNHPVLKSPEAMRFVADHLTASLDSEMLPPELRALPSRLFVERAWTGYRDLANQAEIADALAADGFVSIDPGTMPVLVQAMLFGAADMVIGCMGASMTNTLFCKPGTLIGHIAPEGWIETFYWDLAATRAQPYAACYGLSTPQDSPAWHKNYRVNPAEIARMRDRLENPVATAPSSSGPPDPAIAARPSSTFDPFAF
jgi:hypothetical protein